jgi:DNA-binding SARP family transcriptional activator
MRFGVLGPLQAWNGEEELPLRGATPRAVLALLLVHANQIVLVEQIVESLWDEPPETAPKMVQNAVSRLRKLPGVGDHLVTRFGGYALSVEPTELDATEFEGLVRDAQMALGGGRAADGVAIVERAEALWRGPPYLEVSDERFAQPAIARLEDLRKEAIECRIDAQLALGQGAELVAELEGLVAAYPLREKLRGQLMLALYRAGRQAEALAAFRDARRHLLDELGIAPGPALQRLERAILQQEASLEPAAPEAARRPGRKAGTVVYALLERGARRASRA